MARLPYLDREDLPESERDIYDDMMERFGRIHNVHRAIAHSPELLRAFELHWGEAIRHKTRLDPILRELDGQMAHFYAENLDANLESLLHRFKSGKVSPPT